MTEPSEENVGLTNKILEICWPYRLPVILGAVSFVFFILAIMNVYLSRSDNHSIIIEQSSLESASSSAQIKVDIEGAVVRPGIYELNFGSRIADVVVASGGFSKSADIDLIAKNLNLAAKLIDGNKVYIPFKGDADQISGNNSVGLQGASSPININTASLSDLDTLNGVGPATAQKIIGGRPYQSVDELLNNKIIGKSLYDRIKDKISVY